MSISQPKSFASVSFRVAVLLAFTLFASKEVLGQKTPKPKKDKTSSKSAPSIQAGAAIPANDDLNLADYVPCIMSKKTLYDMRGRVEPDINSPVAPDVANAILENTSNAATDQDYQKRYKKGGTAKIQQLEELSNLTYATLGTVLKQAADEAVAPDSANASKDGQTPKTATIDSQATKVKTAVTQQSTPASKTFARPDDISCSMSVYPWNISRMIFGRTVANNYLAVQVTVRNLDQDHEFLLHDAELAVDATSGQLERFESSSEKEAVRGVTIYGQSYDRRAIFSHSVESIGFILGSIVGLTSVDNLTSASGAFSAGFQPAFNKMFPDLSTNNLNNLNDLAFSAAAASRIVVPKGGSVPFVIFVPVRPLEQACWLQDGYDPRKDVYPATACDAASPTDAAPPTWKKRNWLGFKVDSPQGRDKRYHSWTPDEITALEKHAFAVIAGTHFTSLDSQGVALRSVTCTNAAAKLRVADLKGASLTCVLTGADLTAATTLRLTPASGGDTTKTIDLPLVQGSDSTTASVTLSATQLSALTDSQYTLSALDATGKATDLKQTFSILPLPTGTALDVTTLAATDLAASAKVLTVTGTNLSQVIQLKLLKEGTTDVFISAQLTLIQDGKLQATLSKGTVATGIYDLIFVLDPAATETVTTTLKLTVN